MKKINLIFVFTAVLIELVLTSSIYLHAESNKKNNPVSVQEDPENSIGLLYSVKKIESATNLLKENKVDEAEKLLIPTRDWLTETTEHHYILYQTFNNQGKNQSLLKSSKIEKAHALDFGNLRDQANYLLAKIYIAKSNYKEAIKLLINIIKSQPNTDLGKDAYKTLQEIKFSDNS